MERLNYKIKGLNVTEIKSEKFKTTDFILNFRSYLQEDTATQKALVPYILKAGSDNYQNKKEINRQLEKLYGATLGVTINKQGLVQIISFRVSIVNDEYLTNNQTLLEDAFKFLNEILFKPKLENGLFSEKIVNEEKRLLKDHFTSLYDDKIRYSYDKLIENMFKDETYRMRAVGRIEDIERITTEKLYQTYQEILNEDTVDFLIIGDLNHERVKGLVEKYLPFEERDEIIKIVDTESKEIESLNKIVESQEVNQAKLNIGFRTYTTGLDEDYYPLILLNSLLGVYPHSLLFRNVREKASLCYYISSNVDKAKGVMVIYAGINQKDYDQAVDLIFEQINKLKEGQIDDELIDNTKKALVNDMLEAMDSPHSILSSTYSTSLYNEVYNVENNIKKINKVTKDELIKVAKKIKEDTIFFLMNEEVNE